ncbi:MAG: sigma-54-dependent Fis family transcriptional regulator [Syntrophomonadaceae bacterium]|nr:sigma-54-dependent Fis family transcriptional regulator [Syntrophomonadaceae bacterium]
MLSNRKRILVVDDEDSVRCLLREIFRKEGYQVDLAENGLEALNLVERSQYDLAIIDIRMPVMDGLELFHVFLEKHPEIIVIIITAFASVDTAVEAMKLGAYNYISKPFNIAEIKLNVKRALESKDLAEEVKELRQEIQKRYSINNIIGHSGKMQEIYKTVGRVANCNVTVLIQGESGTGKELIAKAIHYNSRRKEAPLVKVNCAALPEGLLESELFGHEKGAFTGALEKKKGKFEQADKGTLFLDEIGDMSPSLQVKLLRVIQEKEFERVGGLETIKVDVRIIAATNRHLEELVKSEKFREDLYYRLNVVSIIIPPLRERKEDIPSLVEFFLNKYNEEMGKEFKYVSVEAMNRLINYNWPGNVRELENAIERAVVMGNGSVLLPEHLPVNIHSYSIPEADPLGFEVEDKPLREILREVEKAVIKKSLDKNGWNKARTAAKLGLSRKALLYKIEEYGLQKTLTV